MVRSDVCEESKLSEAGDFFTSLLHGVPVLVVKDWSGRIRAFVNECQHQKIQLEWDESGRCGGVFTCPFHGWTYDLEGRNLSPGFGPDSNLEPLPVEVTNGRVIVSLTQA